MPVESWTLDRSYERIWRIDRTEDRVVRPHPARFSAKVSDIELPVTIAAKDKFIRFSSLAPDFANLYADGRARWSNVLRVNTYTTEDSIATVIPSDISQQCLQRMRLGGEEILMSREGLVFLQHFKDHREFLYFLSGTEVFCQYLEDRGLHSQPSDAGRVAEQVLQSVGGFARSILLAHRETLETLDNMAKSVRFYSEQKAEEYPDRAVPVKLWQSLVKKRNNQKRWGPDFDLDSFVKAGILKLGLDLRCPNCLYHNWCGLQEMDAELICSRCLKRFEFPQGNMNFKDTPWQYRVVGPFAVPNLAAGAYATVLALRVFSQNLDNDAQMSYSTGLDVIKQAGDKYELDFAFLYKRDRLLDQDEQPLLAFGEAKSFALASFKERDIQRLEGLATAFPGSFLVFATLKEALSDQETFSIKKVALKGRRLLDSGVPSNPVIVLTATELFSEWHIRHAWENASDKHKALVRPAYVRMDNLWDFAYFTQQLYLDMPDRTSIGTTEAT